MKTNKLEASLCEWNRTQKKLNYKQCLHQIVERSPAPAQKKAVVSARGDLTYQELYTLSNKIGHKLRECQVKPNQLVAVVMEKGWEQVAAVVGILKAGAAYLPVSVFEPQQRMHKILEHGQVKIVLTQSDHKQTCKWPENIKVFAVDDNSEWQNSGTENLQTVQSHEDLAYVIFTSGSTGMPKGVMIDHQGALNTILDINQRFDVNEQDSVLSLSALSFDLSVYDIFGVLGAGGTVVLPGEQEVREPTKWLEWMEKCDVSLWNTVPALMHLLVDFLETNKAKQTFQLRLILMSGDWIPLELPAKIRKHCGENAQQISLGGATEGSIWSILYPIEKIDPSWKSIPYGKPMWNQSFHILDKFLQPVPVGVVGELHIGGVGVAKGYWRDTSRTAASFIEYPQTGEILYKTGDMGRYFADGNIEFLGRVDDQVKIRGFRIELGEIEAALGSHPHIEQPVVTVREVQGQKHLAAYYISSRSLDREDLHSYMSERLPFYMVPSAFMAVEKMPLSANGKVDVQALPKIQLQTAYLAPGNQMESKLAAIWCEVLKLMQVGVNDNFFQIGGNSLRAMQVAARIRSQLKLECPVVHLFEHTTVKKLAQFLQTQKDNLTTAISIERDVEAPLLLSFAQQRLWFIDQYEEQSALYNIPIAFKIEGNLDIQVLQSALQTLVQRHASLRTTFFSEGGVPAIAIAESVKFSLAVHKVRKADLTQNIYKEIHTPFDLRTGPLFRATLLQIVDTTSPEFVLCIVKHHIISDGLSVVIFVHELQDLYANGIKHQVTQLGDLPVEYSDYARWQREYLHGGILDQQIQYWRQKLQGYENLQLPTDFMRPKVLGHKGLIHTFEIGNHSRALQRITNEIGGTFFTILLSALKVVLHRYSGQSDIVVGTPVAGRTHDSIENVIGLFVNTLVLRSDLSGNPNFIDVIKKVSANAVEAYTHQDIPFEKIVDALNVQRDTSRAPVVQLMFQLESVAENISLSLPNLEVYNLPIFCDVSKFDLSFFIKHTGQKLQGTIQYNTDLFKPETIENLAQRFTMVVAHVAENPNTSIAQIGLIPTSQRQRILKEFNQSKPLAITQTCLHCLFEEQVKKTPKHNAVIFQKKHWSYQQLNQQANKLANALRTTYQCRYEQPLPIDTLVGLCLDRGTQMIVGILGILKAGAAYVPIDPEYPLPRIRYLLEDSGVNLLVIDRHTCANHPWLKQQNICIDIDKDIDQFNNENPNVVCENSNLAYMIYTSGSTGKPKGVLLEHKGVINRLLWMQDVYQLTSADRVLQKTTYSFDVSVWEFLWPLISGATVVIAGTEYRNPHTLIQLIEEEQVTVAHFVPSLFRLLLNVRAWKQLNSLRLTICGGEPLPTAWSKEYLDKTTGELYNSYGPTEASIAVSHFPCSKQDHLHYDITPLGSPISNVKFYVLDSELRPVATRIPGELHIAGVALARGYHNREELNHQKFIWGFIDGHKQRLYKTGDIVRWLENGNLEFLGRMDHQVKIRGFRIEIEEIEAVILRHPEISQCAVAVRERDRHKQLLAFYTTTRQLSPEDLQAKLHEQLPAYMLPSIFIRLERMPLNTSGKIDRGKLPLEVNTTQDDFIAPTSELEKTLAEIWQQVLHVEHVGIDDNFFSLGGDSILSIQVISKAREAGWKISPKQLFANPTVRLLALVAQKQGSIKISQKSAVGEVPLTPIQQRFFAQNFIQLHHWNQAFLLVCNESLHIPFLQKALGVLIELHDALRLRFSKNSSGWRQFYDDHAEAFTIDIEQCSLPLEKQEQAVRDICTNWQQQLNIEHGPIWKVGILRGHSDGKERLCIAIHHLVIDGVSWRILLEDLQVIYQQLRQRKKFDLPKKTSSFQDWSHALLQYTDNPSLASHIEYWLHTTSKTVPLLPSREKKYTNTQKYSARQRIALSKELTTALLQEIPEVYHTQINDLLLAALTVAFYRWRKQTSVRLDLEGHGREQETVGQVELSRTVGWFTSVFPVHLEMEPREFNWRQIICSIKEQLRAIPDKGFGFGVLQYLHRDSHMRKQLSQTKSQISFNYLGQFNEKTSLWNFSTQAPGESIGDDNHRHYLLDVIGIVRNQQLSIDFIHGPTLDEESIHELAHLYKQSLEQMIAHCRQPKAGGFTPSDFPWLACSQQQLDEILAKNYSSVEAVYPLTNVQQGLLFHTLYAPESGQYCVQLEMEYNGNLSKEVLRCAWQAVVDKYATLRAKFVWEDEVFWQIVHKQVKIEWCELDWREHNQREQKQLLQEYLRQDRNEGFDFKTLGFMRFCLIQMSDECHVLLWTHHHLLLDGWCLPILLEEVAKFYEGHSLGREGNTHRNYFTWLEQQDKKIALDFWKQQMAQVEAVTPLNIQKPGTTLDVYQTDAQIQGYKHQFSQKNTQRMQQFSKEYRVTLNTLAQFAWAKVLSCYSGQQSVVYGTVTSGRSHPVAGLDKHIGLLINTVPVHFDFKEQQTIESLNRLQQTIQKISDYDYVGLPEIQLQSHIPAGTPLFYSLFVYQNYPTNVQKSQGLLLAQVKGHERTNYPLTLSATPGETFQFDVMYNTNCFSLDSIKRLLHHLEQTILNVLESPKKPVQKINILSNLEKKELLEKWNQTQVCYKPKQVLSEYLEVQAEKNPTQIAVQFAEKNLSYHEFNTQVNQVAHAIRKRYMDCYGQNMPAGTLIGICARRNLQMVVAIWGILKAGAAYVPLEPEYPQQRLDYMVEDSEIELLLTQQDILQTHTLCVDKDKIIALEEDFSQYSSQNPIQINNAHDLAYIIYTSGSTGKPKGVMLEHAGVINQTLWMQETYKLQPQESVLHKTPFSFDFSVTELLWPFFVGAKLVIAEAEGHKDTQYLYDTIKKYNITTVHFVPSMFQIFLETTSFEKLTSLRRTFCGGEALSSSLSLKFLTRHTTCALYNLYGPTETSITVSHWPCNAKDHLLYNTTPIGKPIGNIRLYILDRHLCQVPMGVPGELYISGVGLARGYKNRAQLNDEKFIVNPFVREEDLAQDQHSRMYRTGDLVKRMADGNINFLGRIDFQIKLRGFRIELGEIEAVVTNYPSISQCVVVVNKKHQQLLAFYTANEEVSSAALQAKLQDQLPPYMIPNIFTQLEKMPVNTSGKVDRSRLTLEIMAKDSSIPIDDPPKTQMQKWLAAIWCQVLKIDKVSINDDFFYIGGHSLSVMQVVAKIRSQLHIECPVKSLFKHTRLASLATYLEQKKHSFAPAINISKAPLGTPVTLSFAQQRLWFIDRYEEKSAMYNMPLAFKICGDLQIQILNEALNALIQRHCSLRMSFAEQNGLALVDIAGTMQISIALKKTNQKELTQALEREIHTPFDLTTAPLLRATIFETEPLNFILCIVKHHIISDGLSTKIFLQELQEFYSSYLEHREPNVKKLNVEYNDYAHWQQQYLSGDLLKEKIRYWYERLQGYQDLQLPTDYPRPKTLDYQGDTYTFNIGQSLVPDLQAIARKAGGTMFTILLSAFKIVLSRYSGQSDLIVGTPVANRAHEDLEGMIGLFVNTVALRSDLSKDQSFMELLEEISAQTIEAYAHQDMPFEKLIDVLKVERDTSRAAIVQAMFQVQNVEENLSLNLPGVKISNYPIPYHFSKFDFSFSIRQTKESLQGTIQYNTTLFKEQTMARLAEQFQLVVKTVLQTPEIAISQIDLMTVEQRKQVLETFNQSRSLELVEEPIHKLFEQQVKKTPQHTAMMFEDQSLSYRELNERANQFAYTLQERYQQVYDKSLPVDTLVGLCLERDLQAAIAILGIWKAGGAYVPMDPTYPQQRLSYLVDDSDVALLVTDGEILKEKPWLEDCAPVLCANKIGNHNQDNLGATSGVENLAYMIYTSGSTGNPKGALLEHGGVANRLRWMQSEYELTAEDRVLQKTHLSFDVSVWELFWPLICGATVVIASEEQRKSPDLLWELIDKENISVAHFVPAMFRLLLDVPNWEERNGLRLTICGGEALPTAWCQEYLEKT
ncbi:amino acid adenylation domain-containing protein, partial [Candidatus Uabimicrobium amorphum]